MINRVRKIKVASPFTKTTNIKYPGVTPTKEVNDPYDKNFESLKKISENEKTFPALG